MSESRLWELWRAELALQVRQKTAAHVGVQRGDERIYSSKAVRKRALV